MLTEERIIDLAEQHFPDASRKARGLFAAELLLIAKESSVNIGDAGEIPYDPAQMPFPEIRDYTYGFLMGLDEKAFARVCRIYLRSMLDIYKRNIFIGKRYDRIMNQSKKSVMDNLYNGYIYDSSYWKSGHNPFDGEWVEVFGPSRWYFDIEEDSIPNFKNEEDENLREITGRIFECMQGNIYLKREKYAIAHGLEESDADDIEVIAESPKNRLDFLDALARFRELYYATPKEVNTIWHMNIDNKKARCEKQYREAEERRTSGLEKLTAAVEEFNASHKVKFKVVEGKHTARYAHQALLVYQPDDDFRERIREYNKMMDNFSSPQIIIAKCERVKTFKEQYAIIWTHRTLDKENKWTIRELACLMPEMYEEIMRTAKEHLAAQTDRG